jgi:perosamine synthetase
MIRRVMPYKKQEFIDSMCGYIESYEFYNEGIIRVLEKKIQKYCGRKYALCVNSATNALFMLLYTHYQKQGKILKNEVIIPNYGFPAASRVCQVLDLVPISVDIEKETLSMSPEQVLISMSKWTLAVVHIETNGVVGNAQAIASTYSNDVLYIEDSAPSMLQTFNGIPAGSFGDVGIYSFGATKPMCAGEGAVIVTDREDIYNELKNLRYNTYNHPHASMNFTLSPFLAAYLIPQIDSLNEVISMRERVYSEYSKYIDIFKQDMVTNRYGAIMYMSKKAKDIHKRLKTFGIEHRYEYYPLYSDGDFPISKEVRNEIIDLPMHHELTNEQIKSICELIRRIEDE